VHSLPVPLKGVVVVVVRWWAVRLMCQLLCAGILARIGICNTDVSNIFWWKCI